MERGDWVRQNRLRTRGSGLASKLCREHELPGTSRHDPLAYLQNRHRLLTINRQRELLALDVANPISREHSIRRHEFRMPLAEADPSAGLPSPGRSMKPRSACSLQRKSCQRRDFGAGWGGMDIEHRSASS